MRTIFFFFCYSAMPFLKTPRMFLSTLLWKFGLNSQTHTQMQSFLNGGNVFCSPCKKPHKIHSSCHHQPEWFNKTQVVVHTKSMSSQTTTSAKACNHRKARAKSSHPCLTYQVNTQDTPCLPPLLVP